jgi:hypothetical protein
MLLVFAQVYLHEIASTRRKGFTGSIGFASAISGCILGVLVVLVLELVLSTEQVGGFVKLPPQGGGGLQACTCVHTFGFFFAVCNPCTNGLCLAGAQEGRDVCANPCWVGR